MLTSLHRRSALVAACAALAITGVAHAQTTRPVGELNDEFRGAVAQLQPILRGRDLAVAADRQAIAADGAPAVRRVIATLNALVPAVPDQCAKLMNQIASYNSLLYAIGDAQTVEQTDAEAKGESAAAKLIQLRARWIVDGPKDSAGRAAVVDGLASLGTQHPDDELVTLTAFALMQQPGDPAQQAKLKSIVTDTMRNKTATQLAEYIHSSEAKAQEQQQQQQKQMDASADMQKGFVGKPMTIAGPTPDGKSFSTDQWKGKVVIVDFWATWCGPCKRELPRVKDTYAKLHDQGLEVLGVSLDQDVTALRTYVAQTDMPWPELFDAQAAAAQQPSSIAMKYGVASIPQMFVIDKKGVCRSVTARDDMETLIPKLLAE